MATSYVPFYPGNADPPDNSASNLAPANVMVKSSATAPGPYHRELLFDASQREQVSFSFDVPLNYASAPVLKVLYRMSSATSGVVLLDARIAATTPADAVDHGTKAFGAANTNSGTVPGTLGNTAEISITLTNADSMAAGDNAKLYLARDGASGTDTATGDLRFIRARLEFTTT
jgi:hypothetical protein